MNGEHWHGYGTSVYLMHDNLTVQIISNKSTVTFLIVTVKFAVFMKFQVVGSLSAKPLARFYYVKHETYNEIHFWLKTISFNNNNILKQIMFSGYYRERGLWGIKGMFRPDVQRNRGFRDWWRALRCWMVGSYTNIYSKIQSFL